MATEVNQREADKPSARAATRATVKVAIDSVLNIDLKTKLNSNDTDLTRIQLLLVQLILDGRAG